MHLFPSHPDAYILIKTDGKAFSNLPEFTWVDYNKIAAALPNFVQGMQPIPPMPQARGIPRNPQPQPRSLAQPQYQQPQYQQQQQQRPNCCPPGAPMSNCCVQTPQQPRPFGIPVALPYYAQPALGQFNNYGNAPQGHNGQQSGYTNANGGHGNGPMYR